MGALLWVVNGVRLGSCPPARGQVWNVRVYLASDISLVLLGRSTRESPGIVVYINRLVVSPEVISCPRRHHRAWRSLVEGPAQPESGFGHLGGGKDD